MCLKGMPRTITMQGFTLTASTGAVGMTVEGRTYRRMDALMDGWTEIWTLISHSAISRCDNYSKQGLFLTLIITS